MGTPLTGSTVASTYTGLLKTSDSSSITSLLKAVADGGGSDSALQISSTAVNTTGDFSVATNKVTVASASGNTAIAGTLAVTGVTSLSSLSTTGNATIGGTLGITGGLTIPGTLAVTGTSTLTGAVGIGSTLAVTGASTLASLGVTGAATVGTTLGVSGAATLASLGVTGASTLASLAVTGAATVGTTLGVTGASTLASLAVTGAATVGTTLGVTGATTLGDLSTTGNTTIGNDVTDALTVNANNVTIPNLTSVTVDLANDKVLITDASDSSKVRSVSANQLGITSSNAPQCVQTIFRGISNFTSANTGSGVEITSLNTSITPRSTGSKVLVSIVINYTTESAGATLAGAFKITRNGVEIGSNTIGSSLYGIAPLSGLSDFPGSNNYISTQTIQFLDSPSSASSVTYKLHSYTTGGGALFPIVYLNRTRADILAGTNSAFDARVSSSMTLQEYFA
jgi:hypothetical protein